MKIDSFFGKNGFFTAAFYLRFSVLLLAFFSNNILFEPYFKLLAGIFPQSTNFPEEALEFQGICTGSAGRNNCRMLFFNGLYCPVSI